MSLPINIDLPDGFLNEEVRCGYRVSSEMKKVWAIELDLLNEFQKICKKYNIKYMASGGTMLGAVRHSGFIPWDDDIDLYIFRKDYKKLEKIMNDEVPGRYFWQTENTDTGSLRYHAQFRNSDTTGILLSEKNYHYSFNQGIFIDIFPVDNIPSKKLSSFFFYKKLRILKKMSNIYSSIANRNILKGVSRKFKTKKFMKIILTPFLTITKFKNFFFILFEKTVVKYNNKSTKIIGEIVVKPGNPKTIFDSKTFQDLEMHCFEFLQLPIPKSYDAFLTNQYGDWKTIKQTNSTHGDTFFDAETSYRNYINLE